MLVNLLQRGSQPRVSVEAHSLLALRESLAEHFLLLIYIGDAVMEPDHLRVHFQSSVVLANGIIVPAGIVKRLPEEGVDGHRERVKVTGTFELLDCFIELSHGY